MAGDAPVAFLAEPVEVAFGVAVWGDFDAAVGNGVHGGLGEAGFFGAVGEGDAAFAVGELDPPLVGEVGFDGGFAAVAVADFVFVHFVSAMRPRASRSARTCLRAAVANLRPV